MAPDDPLAKEGAALREKVEALPLSGVWSPLVTPVDKDLAPDPERFVEHGRWLLESGCHGLVAFGSTGEAQSFSVDERIAMVDALLEAGLPAERIIVGTGCAALTDTVRLTAHAVAAGCGGVLVVPPFYFKEPSEDGVLNGYVELVRRVPASGWRLYLYHFPRLSCVPITMSLIERLKAACPGVVAGVKDSSGNWENTRELLARFPDLAIFPGAETTLLPALELGGAGCITATANVNPAGIRAVFDAWQAGSGEAEGLQAQATAIRKAIEGRPAPPALKHLVAHFRNDAAWRRVRPPFVEAEDDEMTTLRATLDGLGFRFPAV